MERVVCVRGSFATFGSRFFALRPTIGRIGSRLRKRAEFFPISGNHFDLSVDRLGWRDLPDRQPWAEEGVWGILYSYGKHTGYHHDIPSENCGEPSERTEISRTGQSSRTVHLVHERPEARQAFQAARHDDGYVLFVPGTPDEVDGPA